MGGGVGPHYLPKKPPQNLQLQRLQKWYAIKNVKLFIVLIRLLGPGNDVLMLGKLTPLGVSLRNESIPQQSK